MRDKKFAAGCNRDVIRKGAELVGLDLPDAIAVGITKTSWINLIYDKIVTIGKLFSHYSASFGRSRIPPLSRRLLLYRQDGFKSRHSAAVAFLFIKMQKHKKTGFAEKAKPV